MLQPLLLIPFFDIDSRACSCVCLHNEQAKELNPLKVLALQEDASLTDVAMRQTAFLALLQVRIEEWLKERSGERIG